MDVSYSISLLDGFYDYCVLVRSLCWVFLFRNPCLFFVTCINVLKMFGLVVVSGYLFTCISSGSIRKLCRTLQKSCSLCR